MMTRGANTKITHEGALAIPESLAEWEQLLGDESIPFTAGLSILDTDFRFLAINKNLAEMHGIPAEAHLGKTIREILGDFAELLEPYYERVKATGQAVLNREISSILPTRSTPGHWIGHHVPIKDSDGRVTRIGVIVVEITKQKKLEESFRSVSENLKDQKKRGQVMTEVGRLLESKWDVRQVFPQVSAQLRRVLRQEYAAISLRDEKSGQLVRRSIDFPLRKGLSHGTEISVAKDPGSKVLEDCASLILNKKDMQGFKSDITDHLLTKGLQSLCCVPLIRPKGPLGVLTLHKQQRSRRRREECKYFAQAR